LRGHPRRSHQGLFRAKGQRDRGDRRTRGGADAPRRSRLRAGLLDLMAAARGILREAHTKRLAQAQAAEARRQRPRRGRPEPRRRGRRGRGGRPGARGRPRGRRRRHADGGPRRERRLRHEERAPGRHTQPIAERHLAHSGCLMNGHVGDDGPPPGCQSRRHGLGRGRGSSSPPPPSTPTQPQPQPPPPTLKTLSLLLSVVCVLRYRVTRLASAEGDEVFHGASRRGDDYPAKLGRERERESESGRGGIPKRLAELATRALYYRGIIGDLHFISYVILPTCFYRPTVLQLSIPNFTQS
jgi:hypothetical protein